MMMMTMLLVACDGVKDPTETNDEEVITTVELNVDGTVWTWSDPENDGDPVIDTLVLDANASLPFTVRFLNELEDPAEDITEEILAEADEHQVFFEGLMVAYGDEDDQGLPVGLSGTIQTSDVDPNGMFRVMLRHLPEEGGTVQKVAGLAEDFEAGEALPGEADRDVTFPVTVQ